MSYCLGIKTHDGIVLASDSRTSAGADQVRVCRKTYPFIIPGERVIVALTTGNLSLSQSVITLLKQDFSDGKGLAAAASFYDAVRVMGDAMRRVADLDRQALERDNFRFNVHFLLGGQIKGEEPELYLIYPQGNPIRSTPESPFLQIGESKYGRPILDRGISHDITTMEQAAKYALLSLDATMRSNATVGPPVDLLLYRNGDLDVHRRRLFDGTDADWLEMHALWEQSLRKAVHDLPDIKYEAPEASAVIKRLTRTRTKKAPAP